MPRENCIHTLGIRGPPDTQGPTVGPQLTQPPGYTPTLLHAVEFAPARQLRMRPTQADNAEHEVVMIHRTVLGSMERFIGGLIEHYGAAFPT